MAAVSLPSVNELNVQKRTCSSSTKRTRDLFFSFTLTGTDYAPENLQFSTYSNIG